MIDPDNVTQYNATREWKEEFLLFCACVAGKSAFQQAKKLEELLSIMRRKLLDDPRFQTPFELIRATEYWDLENYMKQVKLGQYNRLLTVFIRASRLDVDTCTVEDLEAIPGIGPKTARFFIVHTRPNQRYSILDTHILKELATLGYDVPKSTPNRTKYPSIEQIALKLADDEGLSPADWDLKTWKKYRKNQT